MDAAVHHVLREAWASHEVDITLLRLIFNHLPPNL
jgi:hypothetical protein